MANIKFTLVSDDINSAGDLRFGGYAGMDPKTAQTIWDAGGNDTIDASNQLAPVSLNLNEGAFRQIGKAFTDGTSLLNDGLAIAYGAQIENAIGSAFDDVLTGNDLSNTLNGGLGADRLEGGLGNDTLMGGMGSDTLTGGAGADTFAFNDWSESGTGSLRDIITDFSSAQGDKIDLSKFDANLLTAGVSGFSFIGAADFTSAGQLRFVDHILSGNVSGNVGADFEIQLVGVNTFTANDLVA